MEPYALDFGVFIGSVATTLLFWIADARGWLTKPVDDGRRVDGATFGVVISGVAPLLGIAAALIAWLT